MILYLPGESNPKWALQRTPTSGAVELYITTKKGFENDKYVVYYLYNSRCLFYYELFKWIKTNQGGKDGEYS